MCSTAIVMMSRTSVVKTASSEAFARLVMVSAIRLEIMGTIVLRRFMVVATVRINVIDAFELCVLSCMRLCRDVGCLGLSSGRSMRVVGLSAVVMLVLMWMVRLVVGAYI